MKSRSDPQLRGTANDLGATSDCAPEQVLQSGGSSKLIMPCGLIAWSYFNDTYAVGPDGMCASVVESVNVLVGILHYYSTYC